MERAKVCPPPRMFILPGELQDCKQAGRKCGLGGGFDSSLPPRRRCRREQMQPVGMLGLGSTFPTACWHEQDSRLGTMAWHCGHWWHRGSFSHEMALRGVAQSTTGPNPGLGQVMGHASPMSCAKPRVMPSHGLCQAVSWASSRAVPNYGPR